MDDTLLETKSLLIPEEKIESLQPERRPEQLNGDVQQLTLFWKNFLNSTSEPKRVNLDRIFFSLPFSPIVFRLQVEWLELFMYKYETLIKEPGFSACNEQ